MPVRTKTDLMKRQRKDTRKKIKGMKGSDPYEHREWTKYVSVLPNFHHAHIYNHTVLGVSAYTHEV